MLKANIIKYECQLNNYLVKTGINNFNFLHILKNKSKIFLTQIFIKDGSYLIKLHGIKMLIPSNTYSFQDYVLRPYEPYTTKLLENSIKKYQIVLDIEAQFGYCFLIAAKLVREKQNLCF